MPSPDERNIKRFWSKADFHGPMLSPYPGPCWVCINPAHLEPVTHLENQRRGVGVVGEAARREIYGSWPELGRPEPIKRCSSCRLEKKITEFPRDRTGRGLLGYGHRCKACESVRKRRYKRERASKLGLPEAGER